MSLRSHIRDDFPVGWWRSASWWRAGFADLGLWIVACAFTIGLIRRVRSAVSHRDDPSRLAGIDAEKFAAGALVNLAGFFGWGRGLLTGESPEATTGFVTAWVGLCVLNAVAAITVIAVLARSRVKSRVAWSMIDFIDDHLPPAHRPPQTRDEYQAVRLADTLIVDRPDVA